MRLVVPKKMFFFCEGGPAVVRQQSGGPHSVNMVSEVLFFLREVLAAGLTLL